MAAEVRSDGGATRYPEMGQLPKSRRLVVSKTKKVFEIQRDRPLRFGPKKTFKIQCGMISQTFNDFRSDLDQCGTALGRTYACLTC